MVAFAIGRFGVSELRRILQVLPSSRLQISQQRKQIRECKRKLQARRVANEIFFKRAYLIPPFSFISKSTFSTLLHGQKEPSCRSSSYHNSECSRCACRILLFLKVVMVVSKSQYVLKKNGDAPLLSSFVIFRQRDSVTDR